MEPIQLMSDSEKEIMEIIWDNGGRIYISDLLEAVERSGREWKRTTVRTFLTRLMEKGLLFGVRQGKNCEYRASVSREEYLSGQARNFVEEVFDGNVKDLLASLIGPEKMGAEEVRQLQAFWEKCREEMQ
nr:BlaI/MecI/CopY family transcriptional regulator [uncultured Eisenbergiella sp.]